MMKVDKKYYDDAKFDRPEVVKHVVTVCNEVERTAKKDGNRPWMLAAKRVKSLCLKNYKLCNGYTARFCKEWEEFPSEMIAWILQQFPDGKCKVVRHDKTADFEPSNITLKPLD